MKVSLTLSLKPVAYWKTKHIHVLLSLFIVSTYCLLTIKAFELMVYWFRLNTKYYKLS